MIIIGSRKFRNKIRQQIDNNQVIFCNDKMKLSESEKYLGDHLSFSLPESVFITLQKRKGLVMRLINEIKVTVEDIRSNHLGGLLTGLEIWNLAVIPFLFNNSECWVEIPKKAMNLVNSMQNSFFVSLYGTSKGCPIPIFYWDTGILTAENYIIMKKLLFYHHLNSLDEECLAKEIFTIQREKSLPGLVKECLSFLSDLGIQSDPSYYTKNQWKKIIQKSLHEKNGVELLARMESYKKIDYSKSPKNPMV